MQTFGGQIRCIMGDVLVAYDLGNIEGCEITNDHNSITIQCIAIHTSILILAFQINSFTCG